MNYAGIHVHVGLSITHVHVGCNQHMAYAGIIGILYNVNSPYLHVHVHVRLLTIITS